jgi:hypothetical protein
VNKTKSKLVTKGVQTDERLNTVSRLTPEIIHHDDKVQLKTTIPTQPHPANKDHDIYMSFGRRKTIFRAATYDAYQAQEEVNPSRQDVPSLIVTKLNAISSSDRREQQRQSVMQVYSDEDQRTASNKNVEQSLASTPLLPTAANALQMEKFR